MSTYLVTGAAGFIGSNAVRELIGREEDVRGLDDLSTGRFCNIKDIADRFDFIEGSILDESVLAQSISNVDYVLHFAAIPSVPRSVSRPAPTCRANIEGSLRVFTAARDAGVRRVIAASSSSVLGNRLGGQTTETAAVAPISPYAVTKAAMEQYAAVCSDLYDIDIVCLRYFNVFGPNQDPESEYAAVIPRFITQLLKHEPPIIHGDGEQSRDFTYVDNVVEANIQACAAPGRISGVYNIACGETTSVRNLASLLTDIVGCAVEPEFDEPRPGDIRYSCADIEKASETFGYSPRVSIREGLSRTVAWYRDT